MERGKAGADTIAGRTRVRCVVRGSASTGENREVLSTVVVSAGGPVRSSGELPVMGGERRDRVIYEVFARATGEVSLGGDG